MKWRVQSFFIILMIFDKMSDPRYNITSTKGGYYHFAKKNILKIRTSIKFLKS